MSPLLAMILEAIVPVIAQKISSLIPQGPVNTDKTAWVEGFVNEVISAVAVKFNAPTWAVALEGEAEIYLKNLIQTEIAKVDPAAQPPAPAA